MENSVIPVAFLLLILLFSMPAFAEDLWKKEGDQWYCYDTSGSLYRGVQRKYDISYYYLDDASGAMVTDRVVEINGSKYYFGRDGARVSNQWVKAPVENGSDGFEYMYFTSNGKAATGALTLPDADGTKAQYRFSEDGYMLYGYLTDTYEPADYPSAATYYYGTKEQGRRYTGWINITDGSDGMAPGAESLWFYFGPAGKKIEGREQYQVASGYKYTFEKDTGKMVTGWAKNTSNEAPVNTTSAVGYRYFGKVNDGVMKKDEWVSTKVFNEENDSRYYWYYLDKSGNIVNGTKRSGEDYARYGNRSDIARVRKNYYCFNKDGRMLTGFVVGRTNNPYDPTAFFVDEKVTAEATQSMSAYKALNVQDERTGDRVYYIRFFSPEEKDEGVMKKGGAVTVTLDGDEFKVYLDKYGVAYEGVVKQCVYNSGILQTAGTKGAAVVTCNAPGYDGGKLCFYPGKQFLVNKSGKILCNRKVKDNDGRYWVVTGTVFSENDDYTVYRMADREYASKAADIVKGAKKSDWTLDNGVYIYNQPITLGGRKYTLQYKPGLSTQVNDVSWSLAE